MPASASTVRRALAGPKTRSCSTSAAHLRRPCSLTSRCSDISNFGARLRRRSRFHECLAAVMFALAADVHLSVIPSPRGTRLCFTPVAYALSSCGCGSHGRSRLSTLTSCPPSGAHVRLLIFRPVSAVLAFSVLTDATRLLGASHRCSLRFPPSSAHLRERPSAGSSASAISRIAFTSGWWWDRLSTIDPRSLPSAHSPRARDVVSRFRRYEADRLSATVFG